MAERATHAERSLRNFRTFLQVRFDELPADRTVAFLGEDWDRNGVPGRTEMVSAGVRVEAGVRTTRCVAIGAVVTPTMRGVFVDMYHASRIHGWTDWGPGVFIPHAGEEVFERDGYSVAPAERAERLDIARLAVLETVFDPTTTREYVNLRLINGGLSFVLPSAGVA